MMRYRYGTRYHKEDFSEFCRYAHLQIEMLLNHYYLLKGGGNIEEVKDYIKQYNKDINYDKITTVYSIHFNVKWYAFRIEHKPSIPYAQDRVVEHIREMRNELSHRSPGVENFDMVAFKRANLDGKFPLNEAGEVAWNKCDGNQQEELRKMQNNYAYKRYQFSIWAKRQPTHEVLNSIQLVADIVRTNSQR